MKPCHVLNFLAFEALRSYTVRSYTKNVWLSLSLGRLLRLELVWWR